MDITPYVDHLRRDLLAAAESAGDDLRAAAERLGFALDPAARLALMEAISQACAEITTELPSGNVAVRLEGRELAFAVEGVIAPSTAPESPAPPPTAPPEDADEGGLARISLRIPEAVKARAEEAADAAGQSVNTWLVNLIRRATSETAINVDIDLSSLPFVGGGFPFDSGKARPGNRRMTGWV